MPTAILLALKSFGIKLLWSLISEKMVEWMFFKVAQMVVDHTKTPHDDEWLEKIKESYNEK